jgi:hypothetical protein
VYLRRSSDARRAALEVTIGALDQAIEWVRSEGRFDRPMDRDAVVAEFGETRAALVDLRG